MPSFDTTTLEILSHDWDAREVRLREIVQERLAICPPPRIDDAVVASYFFVFRSMRLEDAVAKSPIMPPAASNTRRSPAHCWISVRPRRRA